MIYLKQMPSFHMCDHCWSTYSKNQPYDLLGLLDTLFLYLIFVDGFKRDFSGQTRSFLWHFRFTSLQISAKYVSGLVMGQRMEF